MNNWHPAALFKFALMTTLIAATARARKSKESETGPAFDKIRPTMTDNGTITLEEQRKVLEYLLTPAQQKEPPQLERIYDFALAKKAYQELQTRGWKPE